MLTFMLLVLLLVTPAVTFPTNIATGICDVVTTLNALLAGGAGAGLGTYVGYLFEQLFLAVSGGTCTAPIAGTCATPPYP